MTDALLHPFAHPAKPEAEFVNIVKAEGSTLWDDQGKAYLDGMASLWYCQVGHGNQEIIDAINAQLAECETYHIFDPFTNPPAAQLAHEVISRSPMPDGKVFLGCSGSEAVDTALKMIRLVQYRNDPERQIIVRRTHGYHGTNFGGTTAQGIELNRDGWGDLVPHFVEVPHDDIEATAALFAEHGSRIAGLITEPVQGAGGVHPPSDGYLEGLRRLCDDNGALLCFDEVICGFGRTGSWFGSQTFGVTPDLFTFAKGVSSGYLPVSGVAVGPHMLEQLSQIEGPLRTGYTYSGHAASCAAAIANIAIIEREGLVDRANQIGEQISAGLAALQSDGTIESHRGVGAIWAADIGRDAIPVKDAMLERGTIIRSIGNAVAMCPPLVITDAEITQLLDTFAESINATA